MTGFCLDAGALIALERGDARIARMLREALDRGMRLDVPAVVLAQAWRGGARQARLARFLAATGLTVVPLDATTARAVGELCAITGANDVVDGHVALHARMTGLAVLTSDPDDLAAFGGGVEIVVV